MPQRIDRNNNSTVEIVKLILVGEDDLDDQELLKEVMHSLDNSYILKFAPNGSEVMAFLEGSANQLPCLILLDYNMPGSNGAEILRDLKNDIRYNDIPKLIWSTSGSGNFKEICMELGANDYLVNPLM